MPSRTPNFNPADTIRILVATDNHVGYNERDPIRGDDSWKSFHEVMCLAKERDVDMVLLAGDLFHENKPSRKSMYQVMRSLRMNCYGEKPCELEFISDPTEHFAGAAFNHVNYEDQDINVAIPVFSIHGNHDDPTGDGHLAPLDLLQMSGLINYYGRTPESDNIQVKPILLQKGTTKLALYGLSNIRDERLFQTFRMGGVKFFKATAQKADWFHLLSVHQNHHAYTDSGYLPEHFLPDFMDLVIWGHEHKCEIEPTLNPVTNFRVMQPGSSVATSLVEGEADPKHIALVSINGRDMHSEPIRLKSVRPFIFKEIALSDDKAMREISFQNDNMSKVHAYLIKKVEGLIKQANEEWLELQRESGEELDEDTVPPLPLIRLRVEYTAPEGGAYHTENPQRFSNRFTGRVANSNDVVSFHRKRAAATRTAKNAPEMPEDQALAQLTMENIKIGPLVEEFLAAQSLAILPHNFFADVVGQFVDKDDKNAVEDFMNQSLEGQVKELILKAKDDADEDELAKLIDIIKKKQELEFEKGQLKRTKRKGSRKPRPEDWDSDMEDVSWEDHPASRVVDENASRARAANGDDDEEMEDQEDEDSTPAPRKPAARGGRGRGAKAATGTTRKTAATAAAKKPPAKSTAGSKARKQQISDDEDEDDAFQNPDPMVISDDDEEESQSQSQSQGLFVSQAKAAPSKSTSSRAAPAKAATKTQPAKAKTPAKAAPKQSQLNFSSQLNGSSGPAKAVGGRAAAPKKLQEPSEDEISDDDAFEPPSTAMRGRGGRR